MKDERPRTISITYDDPLYTPEQRELDRQWLDGVRRTMGWPPYDAPPSAAGAGIDYSGGRDVIAAPAEGGESGNAKEDLGAAPVVRPEGHRGRGQR